MMELESGKTVIANTKGKLDGKIVDIAIIYVSEEEGRIDSGDGIYRVIDGSKYQFHLDRYKEKMKEVSREEQLSSVIPPSANAFDIPEESTFYVKEEDDSLAGFEEFEEEDDYTDDVETSVSVVKSQMQKKAARKPQPQPEETKSNPSALPKKNVKVAIAILIIIALIALIVLFLPKLLGLEKRTTPAGQGAENTSVTVAIVAVDKEKGSQIEDSDLVQQTISLADYNELKATKYVAADGSSYTGTPVTGTRASSVIGKTLIRSLDAGSVILEEDLEKSETDVLGSDNESGMQVRLVAVVSSDELDEDMMIELGNYVFTTGQLQDILNSQGQSILPEQEKETTEDGK